MQIPKIWGTLGPAPHDGRRVWFPGHIMPLLHACYRVEIGRSIDQTVRSYVRNLPGKIWSLRPAFQGYYGTNTDRPATYDFLLVKNSNPWAYLARTVSEINGDFGRKSQIFPFRVFSAPSETFPWKSVKAAGLRKPTTMPLSARGKSLTICAVVWIQYHNVMDAGWLRFWEIIGKLPYGISRRYWTDGEKG